MKLDTVKFVAIVAASCVVATVTAKDVYWNLNGSGSWADGTRWEGGEAPTSSDTVRLYTSNDRAVHAVVTDDDWETFSKYSEIVINYSSTLTLDMTQDVSFNGIISGSRGTGKLIKKGANKFVFGNASSTQLQLLGEIIVSNGWLSLGATRRLEPALYRVFAPGVLETNPNGVTHILGLVGDGIVTNGSGKQLCFMTNSLMYSCANLNPPYDFSGTFKGSIGLTGGLSDGGVRYSTCGQMFTSVTSGDLNGVLRLENGILSIASIGNQGGTGASSIGNADDINYNSRYARHGDIVGIRYLGTGGTTSRKFVFFYGAQHGVDFVFDAGETGGLTFTGNWINRIFESTTGPLGSIGRFILDGSNETACVLNNNVVDYNSGTSPLAFVKRGPGVWRLSSTGSKKNNGPIFVEEGTLEFDSLAEAGTICSLGKGDCLYTNYVWSTESNGMVPFAYLLGNGDTSVKPTTGTMRYIGSTAVRCTTRPFAVKGAGRVENGGEGSLSLTDAFAAEEGDHALVLAGSGTNVFSDVTNGVGRLKVVKEGDGLWRLSGNVDISGGVNVKSGTLEIATANYTWYRFNVKELYASNNDYLHLERLAFWSGDGELQALDLVRNKSADGNVTAIQPGQFALMKAGLYDTAWSTRTLDNIFKNDNNICCANYYGVPIVYGNTDTWIRIVLRLPEGYSPVVKYDIRAGEGWQNGAPYPREVKSWSLEGSTDGVVWQELHSVSTNPSPVTAAARWYSDNSVRSNTPQGYAIDSAAALTRNVPVASVAHGAKLKTEDKVVLSGLAYDMVEGGGVIEGFAFAASGTVAVSGNVTLGETTFMPMTFENVTDLSNVSSWTPSVNGIVKSKMRVKASASGLLLCPAGSVISFR